MDYRVSRTYITDTEGRSCKAPDKGDHIVPSASARIAALTFIAMEGGTLLAPVSDIPGDSATATASVGGRVYVVIAERANEAINFTPHIETPRHSGRRSRP